MERITKTGKFIWPWKNPGGLAVVIGAAGGAGGDGSAGTDGLVVFVPLPILSDKESE